METIPQVAYYELVGFIQRSNIVHIYMFFWCFVYDEAGIIIYFFRDLFFLLHYKITFFFIITNLIELNLILINVVDVNFLYRSIFDKSQLKNSHPRGILKNTSCEKYDGIPRKTPLKELKVL